MLRLSMVLFALYSSRLGFADPPVHLCLSPKLGKRLPLFLQLFSFSPILPFLSFWDVSNTYVRCVDFAPP